MFLYKLKGTQEHSFFFLFFFFFFFGVSVVLGALSTQIWQHRKYGRTRVSWATCDPRTLEWAVRTATTWPSLNVVRAVRPAHRTELASGQQHDLWEENHERWEEAQVQAMKPWTTVPRKRPC